MRFLVVFVWVLSAASACAETAAQSVGLRKLSVEVAGVETHARVFYPTKAKAQDERFGPWTLNLAKSAAPSAGAHPLVVISHGLGGRSWNHHLLAAELAKAGFVVAAVQHPDDLKRVGSSAILVLRPLELSATIDAVLADAILGPVVDPARIGAFGFSQGGLTVLRTLGAAATHSALEAHCAENGPADAAFCGAGDLGALRILQLVAARMFYRSPKHDPSAPVADPRIIAAAVAAPVGAPITDLSDVRAPVLIIRAGADTVLNHPFHAERIFLDLPETYGYEVLPAAHHYAFLSPFPDKIASEVGIPAQDPPGFDRAAFLQGVNAGLVSFFKDTLMGP